jgi:undecaprenyl-diphosphatase
LNDYPISVLLGVVEGLTEFLPVSSTAHLRIAEVLLHISPKDTYWKMYTVVIQLGAILALLSLFGGRIVVFFRTFPKGETGDRTVWDHPLSLTAMAFLVTAIPSLLLEKVIGKNLENFTAIGWALLIGGVAMWIIDYMASHRASPTKDVEQMSVLQAIWIGSFQILSAVFPGTSRSMSTISSGQVVGLTRGASLEFSFLLSIPVMVAATAWDLFKFIRAGNLPGADGAAPLAISAHQWIILAIGTVVSFVVALGIVEWFLIWVRKHGFVPFAIYRIILGIILLKVALNQGGN